MNVVKIDEQEPDTTFDDFDKLFADEEENIVMKALDGFLIVLSTDGDIIYVSENINDFIGIQQVRDCGWKMQFVSRLHRISHLKKMNK